MTVQPIVYLICEFKSRDLPSRLLIADYLLEAGYTVIVGQYWGIQAAIGGPSLPPGVCFYATANTIQTRAMQNARKAGFIAIASDEEALPLSGKWMLSNIAPDALASCDLFVANNEAHKTLLGSAANIRVTGNARIERLHTLSSPRPIAEDYILFNTGYGLINSVWRDMDEAVRRLAKASGIDLKTPEKMPAGLAEINQRIAAESASLELTMSVIEWVFAHTPHKIVIRPHPSEDASQWQTLSQRSDRISVVSKSDPLAWIAHAKLLLHSDSTTGLEATVLGTPAINLAPTAEWSSRFVMSEINPTVRNLAEAKKAIAAALSHPESAQPLDWPLDGARNIAAAIMEFLPPPAPVHPQYWHLNPPRMQAQIDKFSATTKEIGRGCVEMCESVFLLRPDKAR
jgi:surface carbohydrate biosynthesis protein